MSLRKQLLALSLLTLLGLMGCQQRIDPVVKIGLVAPFDGVDRAIGYDVVYSLRLAVQQVNARGGINGYRLALVSLDDRGEADLAVANAQALVQDEQVIAVVGHWLPTTTAVATPIYATAGLLFIQGGEAQPITLLSATFIDQYRHVAPARPYPGVYAATAYQAAQEIVAIVTAVTNQNNPVTRANVLAAGTLYLQEK